MGTLTEIAWTDHTFNTHWGCQRVSPGCENCYAEALAKRWGYDVWGPVQGRRFFNDKHWREPVKWNVAAEKEGRRHRVFCASMSDVFEDRPDLNGVRDRLFNLIEVTPWLDWQLLTKRPENMPGLAPHRWANGWPANVWAGTTVEDRARVIRIERLRAVPAQVRFISAEPLLEDISFGLDLREIDWTIIGGESGPGARPFNVEWARRLIERVRQCGSAPFMKQLGAGTRLHTANDGRGNFVSDGGGPLVQVRDRKGGVVGEWPEDIRVRQFPR